MKKRAYIRALWGIYDKSTNIKKRRYRIDNDIKTIQNNPYQHDYIVYVFGDDNYNMLKEKNVKCVKVDSRPFLFDIDKHQFRHKLELIKVAMEDYDEIVYLDWDCIPKKEITDDVWKHLNKKEKIQATLQQYHRRKCPWRNEELRKVPNGGFIYLRDKTLPDLAIKKWEELGRQDNDEPSWAKITDELMGGWQGIDKYWDLFEPMCCNLHKSSPYSEEKLKSKNVLWIHYQGGLS
jgi:hypothetical protein